MTVGIGLVCCNAKRILLAADTRASYGVVSSNDQTAKLFNLPANYCAAVSGTLNQCEDVVSELYHRMEQVGEEEIVPEQTRNCISESYHKIYQERADVALRNDPGITLDQYFHDNKLVPEIRGAARDALDSLEVDVDLIVAGFCRGTPVQFIAQGGQSVMVRGEIIPGNAVIGSGAMAAMNWLNYRGQNHAFGLARSLFHLTEAKQFAEVEPTVSRLRHMVILYSRGRKSLEGDKGQVVMQQWWNRYGLPQSIGLEDDKYNQEVRDAYGLEKGDGLIR